MIDGGLGSDTLQVAMDGYLRPDLEWRSHIVTDTSSEGSRIQLGLGITVADLAAHRQGDDLLGLGANHAHSVLKDYYTTSQVWTAVDAAGGTVSAADIITQTQQAAASEYTTRAASARRFRSLARRSNVIGGYRAQGYTMVSADHPQQVLDGEFR